MQRRAAGGSMGLVRHIDYRVEASDFEFWISWTARNEARPCDADLFDLPTPDR